MATPAQVLELRPLINDAGEEPEFDDIALIDYLDAANGDVRLAASVVWGVKASRLAGLVDVTEGSSSRKMSQLYKQALEMSTHFGGVEAATGTTSTQRTRTRAIVRP